MERACSFQDTGARAPRCRNLKCPWGLDHDLPSLTLGFRYEVREMKDIRYHKKYNIFWLVVWLPFYVFPYIGNLIIPIDELIFFRGVAQPPTSFITIYIYMYHIIRVFTGRTLWSSNIEMEHTGIFGPTSNQMSPKRSTLCLRFQEGLCQQTDMYSIYILLLCKYHIHIHIHIHIYIYISCSMIFK